MKGLGAFVGVVVSFIGLIASLIAIHDKLVQVALIPNSAAAPQATPAPVPLSPEQIRAQRESAEAARLLREGAAREEALRQDALRQAERLAAEQREAQQRAEAVIAAQQQQEAMQLARHKDLARRLGPVLDSIRLQKPLIGRTTQLLGGESGFRIFFDSLDEATGAIEGTIEFPSARCTTKFKGWVSNKDLEFTETEFLVPAPGCVVGVAWRFKIEEGRERWYGEIENSKLTGAMKAFKTRVILNTPRSDPGP